MRRAKVPGKFDSHKDVKGIEKQGSVLGAYLGTITMYGIEYGS